MAAPTLRRLVLKLAGLIVVSLFAPQVRAGFVALDNKSVCYSHSSAGNVVTEQTEQAAGSFLWDGHAVTVADDDPNGYGSGEMYVSTTVVGDSCFLASGDGGSFNYGAGQSSGYAIAKLLFVIAQTQQYSAAASINPHDLPGTSHYVQLPDSQGHAYWRYENNANQLLGRIAPGAYLLEGKSDYFETGETGSAAAYSAYLCFSACNSLIAVQPGDKSVPIGATVDIELTTLQAPNEIEAVSTFQWRKNLQNLANGGRISGATTAHLTIANAVAADSGLYDCLVTQGTIVEPSRQSLVRVTSTTGVDPTLAASDLQLAAPRPNPFVSTTRLQFDLARAGRVSLAVYDALGRRVKELVPDTSMPAGRFAIDWNGTDGSGHRVPGGVYFVHLLAGGTRRLQRAVLMPGGR